MDHFLVVSKELSFKLTILIKQIKKCTYDLVNIIHVNTTHLPINK